MRNEIQSSDSQLAKYVLQKLNDISSQKLSEKLLSWCLYDEVMYLNRFQPAEEKISFYDSLITDFGRKINASALQDLQQKVRTTKEQQRKYDALTKGNKAPDFSLTDSSNKTYTLKGFTGKVVYIDVWASWCDNCIPEFPVLKTLEQKYKDKDIVFISVSIDATKDAWIQKGVLKYHPAGLQLWAGKDNWKSRL